MTGVRRMANAFDARGSTSEASGDDEPSPEKVKAQWTGGSVSSEGWKRWELQRSTTGSSQQGGYARKRRESTLSLDGMADAESSPVVRSQEMRDSSPESDIVTPMNDVPEEVEIANAAVIADVQMQTDPTEIIEPSPPPPYTSPSGDTPITPADLPTPPLHILRSDRSSITPTPDRPRLLSGLGLSPVTPVDTPSKDASRSPHMVKMLQHTTTGINPYAALRRTSSCNSANGGSRIESVLSSQFPEDETPPPGAAVESERSRYSTSRRVTLRPNTVNGLFRKEASLPEQTEREREMETEVASLLGRIVDLESRLDRASRPPSPVSPMLAIFRESVLDRLGLGPIDPEDPLPKRIKELPVYLFFVGMGVGAVMVRVLFGRAR